MKDAKQQFLEEYKALCEKHSIIITGCGCCYSPYLVFAANNEDINSNISHLADKPTSADHGGPH